jgi:WD40 repeat protein
MSAPEGKDAREEEKSIDMPGESLVRRLQPKITISDNPSEVFCVKFSPDGKFLAAGCGDGAIRVFNAATGRLSYNLNSKLADGLPTTSLRFRPVSAASKTKNVLLAVSANGSIGHWHITSGKLLHQVTEEDNQIYCVDYRSDGALFCTAGKDYTLRVYDEATKSMVVGLSGGFGKATPGHSNRVFAVKFHPDDDNVILSAGWDNTVQVGLGVCVGVGVCRCDLM